MAPRWAAEDTVVRSVKLVYPFKAATAGSDADLVIQCRKFIPYEWDVLVEPWAIATGEIITLQSPPFTCVESTLPLHIIVVG
jgi:hypothetical protein